VREWEQELCSGRWRAVVPYPYSLRVAAFRLSIIQHPRKTRQDVDVKS
jgi:hypothetical protein